MQSILKIFDSLKWDTSGRYTYILTGSDIVTTKHLDTLFYIGFYLTPVLHEHD